MMRRYYYFEPEVSGGFGDNVILDASVHPPLITRLHYEFDGWLGDSIVASFPCYLITEDVKEKILKGEFSGVTFDKVEVTISATGPEASAVRMAESERGGWPR